MKVFEKAVSFVKGVATRFSRYVLILFVFVLLLSLLRVVVKVRNARIKVQEAREKVKKLEQENKELAARLEFVKSEEFTEKQVRDKLGLAKEGEIVVILPDSDIVKKIAPTRYQEEVTLPDPNWRKWLNLFFYK